MRKYFFLSITFFAVLLGFAACSPNDPSMTPGFSVSEKKKVDFATGNLQYQASTNSWRIAPNAYDCIGENNTKVSQSYNGWIDLFTWGSGNNPTNTNSPFDNPFYDWGSKLGGGWYTPSMEELRYVLTKRKNASQLWGRATVNGVHGVVLLPDNWLTNEENSNIDFVSGVYSWEANVYTTSQWQTMQNAGAVFLPAAGARDKKLNGEIEVFGVNKVCYYWSSTSEGQESFADAIDISEKRNGSLESTTYTARGFGYAVRLVRRR